MIKYIFLDLDSTICDDRHRRKLLPNYDAYHALCILDPPFTEVIKYVHSLSGHYSSVIEIITGRSDDFERETLEWLEQHSVWYSKLTMRPKGSYTPSKDLKLQRALELCKDKGHEPGTTLLIDDYDRTRFTFQRNGFLVMDPQEIIR